MNKQDNTQNTVENVIFDDEARQSIFNGIKIVYDAVSCTLGPRGKNVIIEKPGALPLITKDGVTVARNVKLKNKAMSLGAELIKEAANQTNEEAGDGTTTATVLTYAMCVEALKLLSVGYSPVALKRGMENTADSVFNLLKEQSVEIQNKSDMVHVATISANGDETIGNLIADAVSKVGNNGVVTIEEAKGLSTSLEIIDGLQIDKGYMSSYFVTHENKMICELNNPHVLVTDQKIESLNDVIGMLEQVHKNGGSLLIIADEINGDALQGLVFNKLKASLKICAIKAPSYGENRKEILKDIAALANTKAILKETGVLLKNVSLNDLGQCKKIISKKYSTVLIANDASETVQSRIQQIKEYLKNVTLSTQEKDQGRARLANLANGAAVIKVGGTTEIEMLEKKDRIEDALNATKAAIDEGIVAGAGLTLYELSKNLEHMDVSEELQPGHTIIANACKAPFDKIMSNSGNSSAVVVDQIKRNKYATGFNVNTGEYCNMLDSGIIDPVKVTRCAFKNALSVASMFTMLECALFSDNG